MRKKLVIYSFVLVIIATGAFLASAKQTTSVKPTQQVNRTGPPSNDPGDR